MKTKLRILLIEDNVADAELIERELQSFGFSFSLARVESEPEFRHEMEVCPPDLILSDHGLPAFGGFKALRIIREERPEIPFIFVSGSNDQGMVVEMYELGATDYVFKHDLGDLKEAVQDALESPRRVSFPVVPANPPPAAQPELKLDLPPTSAPPPATDMVMDHLRFCPRCHRSWDATGQLVELDDYYPGRPAEIVVALETCAQCNQKHWWS